jgi:hypothetical protein
MEEKAKLPHAQHSALWLELREKAKNDPELSRILDAAEEVMVRYSDTLQRLADS